MERLQARLESVQEKLLDLYELNSTDLETHIQRWRLEREEHVCLYALRSKYDVRRVGLQVVPSTQVSESKAKQAIEMQLALESLSKQFGNEPWTLPQTSWESYMTAPEKCFKKGGTTIEVSFDNDPNNSAEYVLWSSIYHKTSDNGWLVTSGEVDTEGLYYEDEDFSKRYYVNFSAEARKYGATKWSFSFKNKLFTSPFPSIRGRAPAGVLSVDAPDSSAPHTRQQSPSASQVSPDSTPSRYKRRGSGRTRGTGRRKRPLSPNATSTPRSKSPDPKRCAKAAECGRRRSPVLQYPLPTEVASVRHHLPAPSGGRLGRLLYEARDPPVVVFRGLANALKCYRYRLQNQYSTTFSKVSSTWKWASSDDAVGNNPDGSRLTVLFENKEQREMFLSTVPHPKTFTYYLGSFDSY